MADILDDLRDLHRQATSERSHYYVAKCAERAIKEIVDLRAEVAAAIRVATRIKLNAEGKRDGIR